MAARTIISVEEFYALPDDDNRYELNDGELITVPPPKHEHDLVAAELHFALSRFVREHQLGDAYVARGYQLGGPARFRIPDVSFLRRDRIANTDRTGYVQGAPDLAIEIVSPSNDPLKLDEKIQQYFEFGSHSVWVVYPNTKRIYVYENASRVTILHEGDTLTSDLLPEFKLSVASIFRT